MWPIDRPPQWVDRSQELTALRAGVEALRQGGGAAVWIGTHRRHLYAKLGVHTRRQAVEQARALGLLAPSARRA
jgi:hypothetical protein